MRRPEKRSQSTSRGANQTGPDPVLRQYPNSSAAPKRREEKGRSDATGFYNRWEVATMRVHILQTVHGKYFTTLQ